MNLALLISDRIKGVINSLKVGLKVQQGFKREVTHQCSMWLEWDIPRKFKRQMRSKARVSQGIIQFGCSACCGQTCSKEPALGEILKPGGEDLTGIQVPVSSNTPRAL